VKKNGRMEEFIPEKLLEDSALDLDNVISKLETQCLRILID